MITVNFMKYRQTGLTVLCAVCLLALSLLNSQSSWLKSATGNSLAASAENNGIDDAAKKALIRENYGKLPLSFEANQGQTDRRVKFLSRGPGYTFFLTATEAVMELRRADAGRASMGDAQTSIDSQAARHSPQSATLRMTMVGANKTPRITGADELPGKSNYFLGSDASGWQTDVRNYAKIKYEAVYPGIDAVYYGNQQQLEYDFIVAPGADPKQINLSFAGAEAMRVDANGDLVLETKAGEVRQRKPALYQEANGAQQPVTGHYTINQNRIGFEIGEYDHSRTLVIDPLLNYSTLLGMSSIPRAVSVDAQGNAYVCGYLNTLTNFTLTAGALRIAADNSGPVFVMKFSANSMTLLYSAIFGGTQFVNGRRGPLLAHRVNGGLAVDAAGNAYVAGTTTSGNFPTTPGAYQRTYTASEQNNFMSGFVVKLKAEGNGFVYSTLFRETSPVAVAVDNAGQAFVTGSTESRNLPVTPGAFQPALDNPFPPQVISDVFVTKFSADGGSLVYSTYLGSSGNDEGMSIALDAAGNAYVAGYTSGGIVGGGDPDGNPFPTTPGAFKGVYDDYIKGLGTFVTKLNPTGTALVYSTVLPGGTGSGNQPDGGTRLALDAQGNVFVMSKTRYANFPTTPGAYQRAGGATNPNYPQDDVTLTKINAQGSALIYSTYIGDENSSDITGGLAIDAAGNAYVLYRYGLDKTPGPSGAMLVKINPAGSARLMAIPFGIAVGSAIALDAAGNIYLTGLAYPPFFPTTPGALQPQFPGTGQNNSTGFFTRISETAGIPIPTPLPVASATPFPAVGVGGRITDGTSSDIKGLADTTVLLVNEGVLVGKGKTNQYGFFTASQMEASQDYRVIPYRQGYAFTPPFIDYNYGPYERESSNFVGRPSATAPAFPQITAFNITGRVKTRDGRGVPNTRIVLGGIDTNSYHDSTTTDADGNYSLTILPAGQYYIIAEKETYQFSPDSLEFKLNQNLAIDFTVTFEPNFATVVSAANYSGELAPESIVTAFGTDLANTTRVATTLPLPTELGTTRVMFRGSNNSPSQAPLFFVSPTQVSFLIPADTTPGPASVQIFYPSGKLSVAYFNISMVAPGLFTAEATGKGLATAVALRVKANGTQSFEPVVRYDAVQNKLVAVPIDLGPDWGNAGDQVFLLMYGTGLRHRSGMSAVSAKLGGTTAQVLFAGAQGDFVGLDQANVLLPRALAGRGEVDVVLSVDGKTANTVKVWIK